MKTISNELRVQRRQVSGLGHMQGPITFVHRPEVTIQSSLLKQHGITLYCVACRIQPIKSVSAQDFFVAVERECFIIPGFLPHTNSAVTIERLPVELPFTSSCTDRPRFRSIKPRVLIPRKKIRMRRLAQFVKLMHIYPCLLIEDECVSNTLD